MDAAACGVELSLIGANGRLSNQDKRIPLVGGIALTQGDIRELQLAKGAMAAGLRMLASGGVEKLSLAGAFGNYIRQASARAIGLLPQDLAVEPVGNSALRGARTLLLAPSKRAEARKDRGTGTPRRARRRPRFPVSLRRNDGAGKIFAERAADILTPGFLDFRPSAFIKSSWTF